MADRFRAVPLALGRRRPGPAIETGDPSASVAAVEPETQPVQVEAAIPEPGAADPDAEHADVQAETRGETGMSAGRSRRRRRRDDPEAFDGETPPVPDEAGRDPAGF